jgi:membrane associated rhomboid family serine protease
MLILTLILFRVDYIKAIKEALSTPKHPISSFGWIMMILLFLVLPWQIIPTVFVVNGNLVNFIVHFIGLMFGLIISYIIFSQDSKKVKNSVL